MEKRAPDIDALPVRLGMDNPVEQHPNFLCNYQHAPIANYCENSYLSMNRQLRWEPLENDDPDYVDAVEDNIRQLHSLARYIPIEGRLYRGMTDWVTFRPGDVVELDSFTSTSLDPATAAIFGTNVFLSIDGEGEMAEAIITNPNEQEVILMPGTKIRINHVDMATPDGCCLEHESDQCGQCAECGDGDCFGPETRVYASLVPDRSVK